MYALKYWVNARDEMLQLVRHGRERFDTWGLAGALEAWATWGCDAYVAGG